MNLTLNDFRNILGKVNDGTVVFTRNNLGQLTGIEKANYGSDFFFAHRHVRAMSHEENEALRKRFAMAIRDSSREGRPIVSEATLQRIYTRLGIVPGANRIIHTIGTPLERREIKEILDIVDNSTEQMKADNETLAKLNVDIDGYMREVFEQRVNAAPFLNGRSDLKTVLPNTFLGFARSDIAQRVRKNLALLKAMTLDEMTWRYESTRKDVSVEDAFKASLKKMMRAFAQGRMPVTRTRQIFASAPVSAPLQDNEGNAEEFFNGHGLMPENDLATLLTANSAMGMNDFSQLILTRAMGYIKNSFREDFRECIQDNGNSAQAAQAAYDARTLVIRKTLAEFANDVKNIASASPENLAKFRHDLAENLLASFRQFGIDPSKADPCTFRNVFMAALTKIVAPFSMRTMAEEFALVSGHQNFHDGAFMQAYVDDFNSRVAALAKESGNKGSIAEWQSQAFLASRNGKKVPALGNNLKNDALEKLFNAFKRERDEADPVALRQRRAERNRQAALRLIGNKANNFNQDRLNDEINDIYITFYKCVHGRRSVMNAEDNVFLQQNEILPRVTEWIAEASDDEIAFLEKFCALGLDKLDENIQTSHLQALGTHMEKPPLYAALRNAGSILKDMTKESGLVIATIINMGLAKIAKGGAKVTDGYFLRMMAVDKKRNHIFTNCSSFLDLLSEEMVKGLGKPHLGFLNPAEEAEIAASTTPHVLIHRKFGPKSQIFGVNGLGTLDPLKIIRLFERAGIALGDFSCNNQPKRAEACARTLALLHFASYNKYDLDGLPEYIQRVTGKNVKDISFSDYIRFLNNGRGELDTIPKGAEAVVNVITGKVKLAEAGLEENDVYVLRDALAAIQKQDAKPVTIKVMGGKTLVLEMLSDGGVRATLKTGDKEHPEKQYRFALNAVELSRALDDIVIANARVYKPGIVASVLPPLPNPARGDSIMRAREVYAKTLCAFTGRTPVDYASISTEQLRQLALDAVAKKPVPNVVAQPPKTFNSAEMIEMHRNLGKITMAEVNTKVMLPTDTARRTIDSRRTNPPTAKEFRSIIADLFLNEDTWAFDAQVGAAKGERIRKLMLANSFELKFVFEDIPGFVQNLPNDIIPGEANAQEQKTIRDKVTEILTALKNIPAESIKGDAQGNVAADTMQKLAAVEDSIEALVTIYANLMQDKVTALFQVQNAGGEAKQLQYQTFAEISGISGLNPDTAEGKFTINVLNEYFKNSASVDQRAMLAAMFRNTDNESSNAKQVAELLKGAGPLLQKMLQGLPPSSFGPETRDALKDMKSRLAPIPEEAVKAQLLELVNSSNGEILSIEVKKVLGAATVGEALLCHVKTKDCPLTGIDCVIKVLRPNIHTAILREKAIFDDIIARKAPEMGKVFQRRYEGILKEFDLTIESENIRLGRTHYEHPSVDGKSVIEISSMDLVENISPATGTLVVKKAEGVTYEEYIDGIHAEAKETVEAIKGHAVEMNGRTVRACSSVKELIATRRRLEYLKAFLGEKRNHIIDFASAWFENGIFGDGFMHGDLHAGNIMVSDNGATVIDFGNCIRLTENEQKDVRNIFTKASLGFGEDAIKSFMKLLSQEEKTKLEGILAHDESFKNNLYGIFKKGTGMDVMARIYAAMNLLQRKGVDVPGSIANFFQSFSRLNDIYQTMTEEMAHIDEMLDTLVLDENALPHNSDNIPLLAMENAPQLVKGFLSLVGKISSNPYVKFDYKEFATIANGYMFDQGQPLTDEKNKPYGGAKKIGNVFTAQRAEVTDMLNNHREDALKTVVPFVEWLVDLEIPGDSLRELRKGPEEVLTGSISETNKTRLRGAIEKIKNNEQTDSQEYREAVQTITLLLPTIIGRFALLLGQVMDPTPRTTKKIFGLAGVKPTREMPINVACANVVAGKLSDSGLFMSQLAGLLVDFWSRRKQLALAIRENMRFGNKFPARKEFAHETLEKENNTLPEGTRLTRAKMRLLERQMENFAWPFDGAWEEVPTKGEDDVERITVTLPIAKQAKFLEALTENLNMLKAALGLEVLPTEVVKLALTYLAQLDPRAALAVRSLGEQGYDTLLVNIEQTYPNKDILKAAVSALWNAPGDLALFQAKPEVKTAFDETDRFADKFEPSIGGVLKIIREGV
ncbi:MAG: hypothetical protein IJS15_08195 [Victivallales bacterium]|nr:hypothetical protein [Victivallales bacterium]